MGHQRLVHRLKANDFGAIGIAFNHSLPDRQKPVLYALPVLEKPFKRVQYLL